MDNDNLYHLDPSDPAQVLKAIEESSRAEAVTLDLWIALGEALGYVQRGCHTHGSPELLPIHEAEFDDGGDPCVAGLFLTREAQRLVEDE